MIVAIASQKGGVGKTTTSISLSAGLARQGKRILLIDLDSQANASKVLSDKYPELKKEDTVYRTIIQRQPLPIHPTRIETLFLVPSHILLSETDVELSIAIDHREARLKQQLDKVKEQFDHIFIDCPPALSWLTLNAFTASEKVLVVVSPGYFELDSIVQLSKTIGKVREDFNRAIQLLGILFVMGDPTINTRTSLEVLRQTYSEALLKTIIPRNTDVRDAHFSRKDIFSFNPTAPAAVSYMKLIQELHL